MKPSYTFSISLFSFIIWEGCNKDNKYIELGYTSNMGGTRHWHGTNTAQMGVNGSDTTWSLPDTSFALKIIDGHTIYTFGNYFTYSFANSMYGYAYSYYYFMGPAVPHYAIGVYYYYNVDSIVYSYQETSVSPVQGMVYYTY